MLTDKQLASYAELCIKIGVNLQKNQSVCINTPVECADIARYIAEAAYTHGAKKVLVEYRDEKLSRIKYDHETIETLKEIPQWFIDKKNDIVKEKMCVISIAAGDPSIFAGVDPEKLKASSIATRTALKAYQAASMSNVIRWLVVSVPTKAWAKQVFPGQENPVDKLWNAIALSMHLDTENPLKAWEKHIETLNRRAKFLNDHNFEYIHMTSKNGTDLKVGLAKDHIWCAAQEMAQDGIAFTANMPTEEIFTAPHKYNVNGVVKNALPLVNQGNIIDDFSVTFKDGRVTDFSAGKGYDALKNIIETDAGSRHIGEIALIGKKSPIHEMGLLFYNTLFDENASCHLAFGKAYPTNVKNGSKMTVAKLDKMGVNDSMEHCDFMVGTNDMDILGVTHDGKKIQLFVDGEWVI